MVIQTNGALFLKLGLETAGFIRWKTYKEDANVERFRGWYGCSPTTCETIWIALQRSNNDECRIGRDANPLHLLLALRFLNAYCTEKELSGMFNMSEKSARKWSGRYTRSIQLLLEEMVSGRKMGCLLTGNFLEAAHPSLICRWRFLCLSGWLR